MSMHKAIKSGKEHRKEYRGAKSVDPMCRNHGGCPYCTRSRLRKEKASKEEIDKLRKQIGNLKSLVVEGLEDD